MRPAAVGFHCPDDVAQARKSIRPQRTSVGALLRQSPPYVTVALIAANVAIYVYCGTQAHGTLRDPTGSRLFIDWQLFPPRVHGNDQYFRLLTAAFLHISPLHILSNMLALAIIGPALERLLGPLRYASVYLLSALGGSAAVYAFGTELQATAGASGAIFGLFAACLALYRKLGIDFQWLVGTIALNFVLTFSIAGISKLGHIGGFTVGLLAAAAIGGLPRYPLRIPARVQAAGLAGVGVLVVAVIAFRTLTW